MKVNRPIPKLTQENIFGVIDSFPKQHQIGFTIEEVNKLLKPNQIAEYQFRMGMLGKTYTLLENKPIYYNIDVLNILRGLI